MLPVEISINIRLFLNKKKQNSGTGTVRLNFGVSEKSIIWGKGTQNLPQRRKDIPCDLRQVRENISFNWKDSAARIATSLFSQRCFSGGAQIVYSPRFHSRCRPAPARIKSNSYTFLNISVACGPVQWAGATFSTPSDRNCFTIWRTVASSVQLR